MFHVVKRTREPLQEGRVRRQESSLGQYVTTLTSHRLPPGTVRAEERPRRHRNSQQRVIKSTQSPDRLHTNAQNTRQPGWSRPSERDCGRRFHSADKSNEIVGLRYWAAHEETPLALWPRLLWTLPSQMTSVPFDPSSLLSYCFSIPRSWISVFFFFSFFSLTKSWITLL